MNKKLKRMVDAERIHSTSSEYSSVMFVLVSNMYCCMGEGTNCKLEPFFVVLTLINEYVRLYWPVNIENEILH